tara:strand:+ start:328 stop:600 length:273 start_codon:yes stop_codon:yes gene_type:complete
MNTFLIKVLEKVPETLAPSWRLEIQGPLPDSHTFVICILECKGTYEKKGEGEILFFPEFPGKFEEAVKNWNSPPIPPFWRDALWSGNPPW